jgi:hypothetical protein
MANKPWFRAKSYGWGWGLPLTWQGWVIFIAYFSAVTLLALFFHPHDNSRNTPFFTGIALLSTVLIIVCYKTGEKPGWRWGKKER